MDKLDNLIKEMKHEKRDNAIRLFLNGLTEDNYMDISKEDNEGKYKLVTESGKVTYTTLPTLAFLVDNYGKKG